MSVSAANVPARTRAVKYLLPMDLILAGAVIMLVVWAVGTFFLDAPGWINLFLSLGVFLVIWRIVVRPPTKPTTTRPGP